MHKIVNGVQVSLTAEEVQEYNASVLEYAAGQTRRDAIAQIAALEATVTQRRLRDAVLTDTGKEWLDDVESQICALRKIAK